MHPIKVLYSHLGVPAFRDRSSSRFSLSVYFFYFTWIYIFSFELGRPATQSCVLFKAVMASKPASSSLVWSFQYKPAI